MTNSQIPSDLSKNSKEWYQEIINEYELEAHHLKILLAAAEALDRIEEARKVIKQEGSYYRDRFDQPKAHPALDVERNNKILFARLVRELGLDLGNSDNSRPPSLY